MIVLWQIPFVLLIVNIIFIQIKENPGYFQLNAFMLPSLWLGKLMFDLKPAVENIIKLLIQYQNQSSTNSILLGAWSLIMIKTGKFWHQLKQFNKEPHYVRSNSLIMRKVIDHRRRVSTIPNIRTRYQIMITSI